MALDRITADQYSASHIQNSNTSRRMSGDLNDFQFPVSKVNDVPSLHRDYGSWFSGASVNRVLFDVRTKEAYDKVLASLETERLFLGGKNNVQN